MTFQQQRPQLKRQVSAPHHHLQPELQQTAQSPSRGRAIEESQEWILFSPQNDVQSLSTSRTPRTATQPSNFGSLETHVRSQALGSQDQDDSGTCLGTDFDEEGAELDSLDDGLHAFQNPFSPSSTNLDQSGGAVLPTHDGLGGFFPSSAGLQEQLWQFERHNPHNRRSSRQHTRRRSSVQKRLDALEVEQDYTRDDERTARIEKWRLDQSRAVLEEIERETRRRRRRASRMSGATDVRPVLEQTTLEKILTRQDSAVQDDSTKEEQPQGESFWRRITRKVIQDLIGLNDTTLSVIFGEQLVDDASPTPTQPSPIAAAASRESRVSFNDSEPNWESKLVDRIARELGILVSQLAEYEGSAFNTYRNADAQQIEYAALPRNVQHQPSLRQRRRSEKARAETDVSKPEGLFTPTVPQTPLTPATEKTDTSLWGIEEEPEQATTDEETTRLQQEREYWERNVDIKMIFTYLKNRLSGNDPAASLPIAEQSNVLPASWATTAGPSTTATPDSQRRAELIRRQHPLVSRAADRAAEASRKRESLLRRHQASLVQKRSGDSSCASQSTKRSRHSLSGSSRHYWDLGGGNGEGPSLDSVGSGPSGLGGWGEV